MKFSKIEFLVGLFVFFGLVSLVILALKVAGLTVNSESESYVLKAYFDNVGSLKIRAPVKVGGVVIGRVTNIYLDQEKYVPVVEMNISKKYDKLSNESKASILTAGLIGDQYIGVTPGFYDEEMGSTYLKNGDSFQDTGSAIVLEDLIGKFLYNMNSDNK
jgi:phospholipid/cholesterol/gamma-HCH transport system substrate-binding protein